MRRATVSLALASLLLAGCAHHRGGAGRGPRSLVVIDSSRPRVVKRVRAEASCRYLLGLPIDDPALHAEAMRGLREAAALEGSSAFGTITADRVRSGLAPLAWRERLVLSAEVVRWANPGASK